MIASHLSIQTPTMCVHCINLSFELMYLQACDTMCTDQMRQELAMAEPTGDGLTWVQRTLFAELTQEEHKESRRLQMLSPSSPSRAPPSSFTHQCRAVRSLQRTLGASSPLPQDDDELNMILNQTDAPLVSDLKQLAETVEDHEHTSHEGSQARLKASRILRRISKAWRSE